MMISHRKQHDPYLPHEAQIIERVDETGTIFTLITRFTDPKIQEHFTFKPGQFNMLYHYGVGEVPISIVSDPDSNNPLSHTIRRVGQVTNAMAQLKVGDRIGIRGPYGRGWPLFESKNKDVLVVTGGLGCAPVISVINYTLARREQYGKIHILQGVKHSDDYIFRKKYDEWRRLPNTDILIAADVAGANWPFRTGYITDYIAELKLTAKNTVAMMCGPEGMMKIAVKALLNQGLADNNIYLSMERNMHCALGHCGHCQYGGLFVCKDGPVFSYQDVRSLFEVKGF